VNPGPRKFLLYWLPALLWMPLVLGASSDPFSAEHTGKVLKVFFGWMQPEPFDLLHFMIRKLAHLSEYGILAFLFFRAWRATFPLPGISWGIQWARIAFFMTALVACLDEWHQTYLPKRTGNLHDILLDSTAALVAQVVLFLFLRGPGLPKAMRLARTD